MDSADTYSGPKIIGRGGRGTGKWVWVTPGMTPVTHPEVHEADRPGHESNSNAMIEAAQNLAVSHPLIEQTYMYANLIGSPLPAGIDVDDSPHVRINVLGPIEISPWVVLPTRNKVIELACFLALHRRHPVSMEELQIALSGDLDEGPETSAKSVRTYMSDLRRSLGADHVPVARGAGYGLAHSVECDWDIFKTLAEKAPKLADNESWALGEALNLVRGRPFQGTTYPWVDAELLVSEMEVFISRVARRMGEIGRDLGQPDVLWFAGRQGVLACPYDLGLWEMALEGAAGFDPDELTQTWHDAQVTLGGDADGLRDQARRFGLL